MHWVKLEFWTSTTLILSSAELFFWTYRIFIYFYWFLTKSSSKNCSFILICELEYVCFDFDCSIKPSIKRLWERYFPKCESISCRNRDFETVLSKPFAFYSLNRNALVYYLLLDDAALSMDNFYLTLFMIIKLLHKSTLSN